ncbi:hypothetical protein [Sagittula sp.]|uniref:hypothetical protein n=1 Tax=Sagittula sp. TaxID=2038081 RepID=UPI0035118CF0
MKKLYAALVPLFLSFPFHVHSEVVFPIERKAFAPGEYYPLDAYGEWLVLCERDAGGEDYCFVSTVISDYEIGLELTFRVFPYGPADTLFDVDVDVAPRAALMVLANSEAEHYGDYQLAITEIDGAPYEGFWCNIVQDECFRGPELSSPELSPLLQGKTATFAIFKTAEEGGDPKQDATINVPLEGLAEAYDRAIGFTASVMGATPSDFIATEMCTFRENGRDRRLKYTYDEDFDVANVTFRESTMGPKFGGTCPAYVTQAYLMPDATYSQRNMFCLLTNEDEELAGFQLGERDAYGRCEEPSKSFCERVNNSKEAALAITGFGAGAVGASVGTAAVTGTTVVAHSSGALIVTGSAGYIGGTLGTIGTVALGVLTAPATITAAAVSVVAVGGSVIVCSE